MTRGQWPYPGDTPLTIARKVAQMLWEELRKVAPEVAARVATKLRTLGQHWVTPLVARYEADDWLKPGEAATEARLSRDSVGELRRKGRLKGRQIGGVWHYQAREIWALSTQKRRRGNGEIESGGRADAG